MSYRLGEPDEAMHYGASRDGNVMEGNQILELFAKRGLLIWSPCLI
jgi:hypothetical protein